MNGPQDLYPDDETYLKEEYSNLFQTESSSFFAYLNIPFWQQVVEATNSRIERENYKVSGSKMKTVTLDEVMKFMAIGFSMTILDKGEYRNYWYCEAENEMFKSFGHSNAFSFSQIMSLKRYEKMRSAFSFRDKRDPLSKIRPLVNVLTLNSGKYIVPGRNVTIDEASIACRSKFGRFLIVFNKSKPGGKYHFKLYVLNCATSWIMLNFRIHCDDTAQDRLLPLSSIVADVAAVDNETKHCSVIRQNVLELTATIWNTKRILNTDNFYTGPILSDQLKSKGIYSRGTLRKDRSHIPKHILYTKDDLKYVKRGEYRYAVCRKSKQIACSWIDAK